MGGGASIWASPEWRNDPREIFNWRLFYLTVAVAFAGCSYGFDQGNIGGVLTLPSFKRTFGLDQLSEADADKRSGDIAAMMAAGGSAGALLAAPCADYLGRKNSMILFGFVFLLGATMRMSPPPALHHFTLYHPPPFPYIRNTTPTGNISIEHGKTDPPPAEEIAHLGVFYAGRLIGGLGIGGTSMLAPQYLAENSPKSVRGSLTTSYNLCIVMALTLAFWTNYGISLWGWSSDLQWKLALSIQLIPGGFMFLMMFFVIDTPRALIARGKRELALRNLSKLRNLPADHPFVAQEYAEVCAQVDAEQELAAGSNYWLVVKDIATVPSNGRRFFLAVMLFIFHKFTGTDSLNYFAPEIFEMIGVSGDGSLSLMTTGVYGVVKFATTILYVAFIIDRVGRRRPLILGALLQATAMLYIALYVRFASPDTSGGTPAGGIVGIVWIYIYAFGWSFGWSVAPYVVAAEIFPARIRSFSMSVCFFVNWIVDYGITKATPLMMTNLGYGTFLLYAVLTYVGAVFVYFCMPEFKGRSIESTDDLFQHSIWTMFRRAYPAEEDKVRHDVQDMMAARDKLGDEEGGQRLGGGDDKAPELTHVERTG